MFSWMSGCKIHSSRMILTFLDEWTSVEVSAVTFEPILFVIWARPLNLS